MSFRICKITEIENASKFGVRNLGVPAPFAPAAGRRQSPSAVGTAFPSPPAAAGRRNGGKAYPLLRGKVKRGGRHSGGNGVSRFI